MTGEIVVVAGRTQYVYDIIKVTPRKRVIVIVVWVHAQTRAACTNWAREFGEILRAFSFATHRLIIHHWTWQHHHHIVSARCRLFICELGANETPIERSGVPSRERAHLRIVWKINFLSSHLCTTERMELTHSNCN